MRFKRGNYKKQNYDKNQRITSNRRKQQEKSAT